MSTRPGPYQLLAISMLAAGMSTAQNPSPIRFEDVTAQSGINFTHSFGAEKLGSLVESTGAGCVWFDYNNDGKPDLFVASGRPLGKDMHPYPLRQPPAVMPHNHLYRNDGSGKFTDVTEQAGVGGDGFSFAAIAADFDNDGFTDLLVTSYGHITLYRNKGDGTFEDVTAKAGLTVKGWAIGATWLDYRPGRLRRFVCGPLCGVRSCVPRLLCRRQLPRWRKRNSAVQRPGADSRNHHVGQLCKPCPLGSQIFRCLRYDGRNWRNFLDKDSGLPSNFLNQVKTIDGTRTWFSTDKGLAYYDGERWATYRPALDTHLPEMLVRDEHGSRVR
jgi:hypothetical protein